MAHKIFGERFLSRVEPAWHGLGILFPEDELISPSEAVRRVAGDLHFAPEKLFYELNGQRIESAHQIILRLPTPEDQNVMELGVTTERWHCTPFQDLAKALDKLDTTTYKVETAGILCGGELCFFSLRGEDWKVLDQDEVRSYFVGNLSQRIGTAHWFFHTTVRVVCWNTNESAKRSSKIDLRIPHGADAAQQIGLAGDLLVRFKKAQEETKAIFDTFAATPAPLDAVDRIMGAAFPEPTEPGKLKLLRNVIGEEGAEVFKRQLDPQALQGLVDAEERYERDCQRQKELRDAGIERFEAFEPESLSGTVWAAYNGATEVSDWRGNGKRETAESVLVGSRRAEKVRAFQAACDVCDLN